MRTKETTDHYRTLGISPTATSLEIKTRYRALSKQHHPDMGGNQAEMAKINIAYHVLSDTFKRAIYDAERRRKLLIPPRPTTTAPQQPVPVRRPTPRTQQQPYAARPKHRATWWMRFAWGFAALVIVGGLLLHLPIAEALSSDSTDIPSTIKTLDVTYEPGNTTPTTTAENNNDPMPAVPDTSTPPTPTSDQTENQTCSTATSRAEKQNCYHPSCDQVSCQQVSSKKNCITKSIGFYEHTVCSAPSGTTNCTSSIGATSRHTECY